MPEPSKTVLLVDDDPMLTMAASLRFEAAGYRTRQAEDGQAALDAVAEETPDLIVMEVRMPRLDGIAALRQLRVDGPTSKIPVVMLSASLQHQDTALDAGASFFVKKPYLGADLMEAAAEAMRVKT